MSNEHVPVLLKEALTGLNIKPEGIYLDLTLGRGGHAKEILKRLSNKGRLIAFDKDLEAIKNSRIVLENISNNFTLVHSDYRYVKDELTKLGIDHLDGVLMDLGVSSPQFDDPKRGFSYRYDSALDMRMDRSEVKTAYDIINNYSLSDLTRIFRLYGEDKYSYQIAKKIVKARESKEIQTTFELVDIIKSAKPMKELAKKGHPAKQIFQALRIEVNDELNALKQALEDVIPLLNKGGRLVVISFQSLEDKITKDIFKKVTQVEGSRHNVYTLPTKEESDYLLGNKKVIVPSLEEIQLNHRAESAKMRILIRKED